MKTSFPRIIKTKTETLPADISGMDVARYFSNDPGVVFLKSGGDKKEAGLDMVAVDPFLVLTAKNGAVTVSVFGKSETISADVFDVVSEITKHYKMPQAEPFCTCGLFGYLGYELLHQIESVPRLTIDDLSLPDIYLIIPRRLFVFDSKTKTGVAITHIAENDAKCLAPASDINFKTRTPATGFSVGSDLVSGFSESKYKEAVSDIISRIGRGDVYQVNLSQRFSTEFSGSALELFSNLFDHNPAAFYAFIQAENHHIVSTSPERFIRRDGRKIETRPIKGTRPRGLTQASDDAQKAALVSSDKDGAELSMIVDLMRNDLGRVCDAGSISVTDHKRVESYTNVHHLVSTVEGTIKPGTTTADLIRAVFPAGSITGCPKIRSMEIISELEPVVRHVYTGAIGYLGFDNRLDLSVAIRTAIVRNNKLYLSAGGGVVWDSDPGLEYKETFHKADTFIKMLDPGQKTAPQTIVFQNGIFLPESGAAVPAFSNGAMFGKGCFETIRANGMDVLYLDHHLARMRNAWVDITGRHIPDVLWLDVIRHLIRKNQLEKKVGAVKIMVMEAAHSAGPDTVIIRATPYIHRLEIKQKKALDLIIYPKPRQTHLSRFKTMNYLYYHLAGQAAAKAEADEAIIINTDGSISETNTANIAIINEGNIRFAGDGHALNGIMAEAAERYLSGTGWQVSKGTITTDDLFNAGGVFITNSLMGAVPVKSINHAPLPECQTICDAINNGCGIHSLTAGDYQQ